MKTTNEKQAGGGAGITFNNFKGDARFSYDLESDKNINITHALTQLSCDIESFDAFGYEDGMSNIKGSILGNVIVDIYLEDILRDIEGQEISEQGEVYISSFDINETLFKGWVRGSVEEGDRLIFEGECEGDIDGYGYTGVRCSLGFIASDEFVSFYQDVFGHYYPSDEEIKDMRDANEWSEEDMSDEEIGEMLYEVHEEDNRANYGRNASKKNASSKSFFEGYAIAALWSSYDEDGNPLDSMYSISDIAPSSLESMKRDCDKFYDEYSDLFFNDERAGHDFWLTRNHHGAGFWDGDYEKEIGKTLTDASHAFGESNLYIGDDGLLYVDTMHSASKKSAKKYDGYIIDWWAERDRHSIVVTDENGNDVWECWDEDCVDMVEDGFIKWENDKSVIEYLEEVGIIKQAKEYDPNPWAVCTKSVGREDKEKYERCVKEVKKKQSNFVDSIWITSDSGKNISMPGWMVEHFPSEMNEVGENQYQVSDETYGKILNKLEYASKKQAVDQKAKDYWEDYFGDYGKEITKEFKEVLKNVKVSHQELLEIDAMLKSNFGEDNEGSKVIASLLKKSEDYIS